MVNVRPGEPPWSGAGYPFGVNGLVVKSIPSRSDSRLGCWIEDGFGRRMGAVRPVNVTRWQTVARFLGTTEGVGWQFQVTGADGVPMLYIHRPRRRGWSRDRFETHDSAGRYLGRLIQNNSYLNGIRTFNLENADQRVIGRTTFDFRRLPGRFGEITAHTVTLRDDGGAVLGGIVQRRTTSYFVGNDFYDYTLTFQRPPSGLLGCLGVAVVMSEYLRQRELEGGVVGAFPGV